MGIELQRSTKRTRSSEHVNEAAVTKIRLRFQGKNTKVPRLKMTSISWRLSTDSRTELTIGPKKVKTVCSFPYLQNLGQY